MTWIDRVSLRIICTGLATCFVACADKDSANTIETDDVASLSEPAKDTGLKPQTSQDIGEPPVSAGDPCLNPNTDGASATCLKPTQTPEYYIAEALKYFDTLDTSADPDSIPNYSELVVRWEWPPWLLLTGYGKQDMIDSGKSLKVLDPSTVPIRDCRFFEVQPFARCTITFEYEKGPCPIYEEFTFNDAGEMTFIEAWSDLPGLRPQTDTADPWGEKPGTIARLSTRVPGLGNAEGRVDWNSTWVLEASKTDPDVADLAERTTYWQKYWLDAVKNSPEDFFAQGCGW